MYVDYLELLINSSNALQKIISIEVEQSNHLWKLKPQMNVLIVSPFGTKKSTMFRSLVERYPTDFIILDDYSPPALMGSISKLGMFIKGTLLELGGKTLIIDEFSEIKGKSKTVLLNLIENQRFRRSLGFRMFQPFHSKSKFHEYHGKENMIWGKIQFTVIAGSMYWTTKYTKDRALLSRFNPVFLEPTLDEILQMGKGKFEPKFENKSTYVTTVKISEDAYKDYYEHMENTVRELNKKYPIEDKGFVLRINSDIIRLSVADIIMNNPKIENDSIFIGESKLLLQHLKYFPIELICMKTMCLNLTQLTYLYLKTVDPSMKENEVAEKLDVSKRHLYRIKNELKELGLLRDL